MYVTKHRKNKQSDRKNYLNQAQKYKTDRLTTAETNIPNKPSKRQAARQTRTEKPTRQTFRQRKMYKQPNKKTER